MAPIRIVIADDHPAFRLGIRDRLLQEPDMEVLAEASDGREALARALELLPDVLLLDMDMPYLSGVEVTQQLAREAPDIRVLVLSAYEYEDYIFRVLDSGAAGYLTKQEPLRSIVEAIRGIAQGEEGWLSRRIASMLLNRNQPEIPVRREVLEIFSERELEVLQLVARGYSNEEVAEALYISESTVKKHVNSIYDKTGIRKRAAIVAWVWENGLMAP